MKTLFLDFASHEHSLALLGDADVASFQSIQNPRDEAAVLEQIFTLASSLEGGKPDRILAVTGPGGFMGLRVGLTLANTLAWAWKVPVGGVMLSELWKRRSQNVTTDRLLWVHATKREACFIMNIRGFPQWKEPTLLSMDQLQSGISETSCVVGEILPEQRTRLPLLKDAEGVVPLSSVLVEAAQGTEYSSQILLPWYGREP